MSSNNDNNNRMAMPRIGFGTFFSDENNMKKIKNAIDESFEIGYNAYDCAEMYQSTKAVGERIATKPRELLWITSKLIGIPNDTDDNYTILKKRVEDHLEQLGGLKYVDLLLIHFPGKKEIDLGGSTPEKVKEDATFQWFDENIDQGWKNMVRLRKDGLCRNIGISNFYQKHLDRLLKCPSVDITKEENNMPFANEIYVDPTHPEFNFVEYMQSLKIKVIAYRSLAFLPVIQMASQMGDVTYSKLDALKEEEGHKSIHETIIKWLISRDIYVLVKSTSKDHLSANYSAVADTDDATKAMNYDKQIFGPSEMVLMCGGTDEYADVFKSISLEKE